MAIDYDYLENRFFEILLKFLPERKYVDLEDSSLASQFESSTIHVNYNPNEPIWFFKDSIDGSIIYFFGLKDENNIKLTLKFNKNKSKSSIELFTSGKIAVKVRFTKEGAEIFDPMKKIFKIRNPSTK